MGRSRNTKKGRIFRYVAVCFAWVEWTIVTLSCISYHPDDPVASWVTNAQHGAYARTGLHAHNWCGGWGATIGFLGFEKFGPGVLVGLVLVAIFLFCWSRRDNLREWPLRLVGGGMVMIVVSAMFQLMFTKSSLPSGPGGVLGLGVGDFLYFRFGVGAYLILLLTLIMGMLLIADEFMLALPGWIAATWNRMPRQQLAGAATGAAGGLWVNLREMVEHLSNRGRMGRIAAKRKVAPVLAQDAGEASSVAVMEPPETNATATETEPAATAMETKPEAVPAFDDGEEDVPVAVTPRPKAEPGEPIIRKPLAAKTLPFKPAAPASYKQDLGNYRLPGLDLLDEAEPINPAGQEQRVREKAKALEGALESFGIDGKVEAIDTGPVVTLFEIGLAPGIKSSQVAALSKDIARALKSPPVRIIDNIPGKSTMGVEVPNLDRERVRLKELMQIGHDVIERMQLPMCLGKDVSGNAMIEDLAKMPHILIAGTTGSGKSVCINSIIMTMLLTQRPDHVKMILVDPKMVEMQDYKNIPHLMAPIIDDMSKAESILEWATQKMDERYEIMAEAGVRNIRDYNKLTREMIAERFQAVTDEDKAKLVYHIPYIVIIIDELADLMMTSKEVEGHIVRIAQKARAVGIHLILATQRPEAQVVTGLIKSNMPGRICFQVRSRLDSRIMLDQSGGELLLGQGDMMMLKPTGGGLCRAQGTFIDDKEMRNVCKFLKDIAEPEFHPELMQLGVAQGLAEGEEKDPLYNEAVDIMIETGRGSVSLIQRRLNIGYSRASRLIDQMRRTGIVGAYKGSMASEVTVTKDEWEAMKASGTTTGLAATAEYADDPGQVGAKGGAGKNTGYAQQVNTTFEEEEEDGVPDEMPGEHRQ